MNGWVTVTNNAGTTFKDIALKLVAGDVHRAPEEVMEAIGAILYEVDEFGASQFEEEALFEYHRYNLQRRTTLKNNEQKQISLLEVTGVDVEKEYVYDDIRNLWWYAHRPSNRPENSLPLSTNTRTGARRSQTVQLSRVAVHLRGPLPVLFSVEQHPERVVSPPVPRLQLDGPFHGLERFIDATEPVQGLTTVEVRGPV